ncbi:MAG: FecR domain-containing protein [Gemmatimonadaceae bacterium]|nr:FecR domain-containing protein [Gemmatimonadaceae bacterium]
MTTGTLTPIAPEAFDALKRGDESTLEQLFKADYAPLESEAEATLRDPAAAARAVEHAFVHAWAEREKVDTPEGFNATLLHALHEETARERRRIAAAQRMASGRARTTSHDPVSADAAWEAVQQALHPAPIDDAASHARQREEAKHHTAHHVAALGAKPNTWAMVATVLLVIALGIGAVVWLDREGASARVTAALSSPDARLIKTEPGQMGGFTLGDGGEISLGPQSAVRIPPGYNARLRAVRVEGAAVITVAPNAELPFEARLGDVAVVATGTRFALRHFPEESVSAVRVLEGSVNVRVDKTLTSVVAGQTLLVTANGSRIASDDERVRSTGWVDGTIRLSGITLEQALPELRRWWGLVLTIPDASVRTRALTMDAPLNDVNAAIAVLESAANVRVTWENKQMVLRAAP